MLTMSVQFSSVTQLCPTLCEPMDCSTPGFPVQHQLPDLAQTHVHWVGDATQPSNPLSSPFPPAFSLSNEYLGRIFFRIDWSDLFAVQGTLKSHLQHHSSKATILQHSVFFMIQFSHPYMTTGKTIALTKRTFVGKVMSPLLNMPSRLVKAFLPRSKGLVISWLQSPSAVILEPKNKVWHFPLFPHLFPMKWWDRMPWS